MLNGREILKLVVCMYQSVTKRLFHLAKVKKENMYWIHIKYMIKGKFRCVYIYMWTIAYNGDFLGQIKAYNGDWTP